MQPEMWPNPQSSADLVTFTEEILNEKLHILCGANEFTIGKYLSNQILQNKLKKSFFVGKKIIPVIYVSVIDFPRKQGT